MTVVLDLATASLQEIGVLESGETPDAAQGADALATLNRMVDQWAAEHLQFYVVNYVAWTIVSGTGSYTIGASGATGATINPRPNDLEHVSYLNTAISPALETMLTPLTDDSWANLTIKDQQSAFPTSWYYKPTFPLGILFLWPVPTSASISARIYYRDPVVQFAALSTTVSLPPGYQEAIVTNLALRLGSQYGKQADPSLRERAMEARAIVKRANVRMMDLTFPPDILVGSGSWGYDIRTGP